MKPYRLSVLLAVVVSGPLLAQSISPVDHAGHGSSTATDSPAIQAFKTVNQAMHRGMDVPFSGDPDIDFIRGMIPHHQGAVEMAKIVLQYGKEAQVRAFAENVIKAQDGEVLWMEDWLNRNGAR